MTYFGVKIRSLEVIFGSKNVISIRVLVTICHFRPLWVYSDTIHGSILVIFSLFEPHFCKTTLYSSTILGSLDLVLSTSVSLSEELSLTLTLTIGVTVLSISLVGRT